MYCFMLGLFVGVFIGVFVICLVKTGKLADEEIDRLLS